MGPSKEGISGFSVLRLKLRVSNPRLASENIAVHLAESRRTLTVPFKILILEALREDLPKRRPSSINWNLNLNPRKGPQRDNLDLNPRKCPQRDNLNLNLRKGSQRDNQHQAMRHHTLPQLRHKNTTIDIQLRPRNTTQRGTPLPVI